MVYLFLFSLLVFRLILLILGLLSSTVEALDKERRTDEYCMKSAYHKEEPGPEESLFGEVPFA